MKKIKLEIENFKSIENLSIELNEKAFIIGQNGTGKTSILDAIFFIIDGKDYLNNKIDNKYIRVGQNECKVKMCIDEYTFERTITKDKDKNKYTYKVNDNIASKTEYDNTLASINMKRYFCNPLYIMNTTNKELLNLIFGVTNEYDTLTYEINKMKKEIEYLNKFIELCNEFNVSYEKTIVQNKIKILGDKIYDMNDKKNTILDNMQKQININDDFIIQRDDINVSITENNITFDTFNFSKKLLTLIDICVYLQNKNNISLPVFIDFGESISINTYNEITKRNVNFVIAKVTKDTELQILNIN